MATLGQLEVGFLHVTKRVYSFSKFNGSQNRVFQKFNIEMRENRRTSTWFVDT